MSGRAMLEKRRVFPPSCPAQGLPEEAACGGKQLDRRYDIADMDARAGQCGEGEASQRYRKMSKDI